MKFSKDELTSIKDAIERAEKGTAAEIIPVVAESSARYDRAEDTFGILLAALAILIAYVALPIFEPSNVSGSWDGVSPLLKAAILVVTLFISFILGTFLAGRIPALCLLFVSKRQLEEEVQNRAANFFHTCGLRRTKDATGVLIYVSLFEHRAVVLADDNAMKALQEAQLKEICDILVEGFKRDEGTEGITQAIARLGQILAESLPRQADDHNELPNGLVILKKM